MASVAGSAVTHRSSTLERLENPTEQTFTIAPATSEEIEDKLRALDLEGRILPEDIDPAIRTPITDEEYARLQQALAYTANRRRMGIAGSINPKRMPMLAIAWLEAQQPALRDFRRKLVNDNDPRMAEHINNLKGFIPDPQALFEVAAFTQEMTDAAVIDISLPNPVTIRELRDERRAQFERDFKLRIDNHTDDELVALVTTAILNDVVKQETGDINVLFEWTALQFRQLGTDPLKLMNKPIWWMLQLLLRNFHIYYPYHVGIPMTLAHAMPAMQYLLQIAYSLYPKDWMEPERMFTVVNFVWFCLLYLLDLRHMLGHPEPLTPEWVAEQKDQRRREMLRLITTKVREWNVGEVALGTEKLDAFYRMMNEEMTLLDDYLEATTRARHFQAWRQWYMLLYRRIWLLIRDDAAQAKLMPYYNELLTRGNITTVELTDPSRPAGANPEQTAASSGVLFVDPADKRSQDVMIGELAARMLPPLAILDVQEWNEFASDWLKILNTVPANEEEHKESKTYELKFWQKWEETLKQADALVYHQLRASTEISRRPNDPEVASAAAPGPGAAEEEALVTEEVTAL